MTRKLFLVSAVILPVLAVSSVSLGDIKSLAVRPIAGTQSYHGGSPVVGSPKHFFPSSTSLPFTDEVGDNRNLMSTLTVGKHGISTVDSYLSSSSTISSASLVFFKIDKPSSYSLSGSYTVDAPSTALFNLDQFVWLMDETTGATLYEEFDSGPIAGSATWTVGDDDSFMGLPGPSLTGLLTDTSHVYSLFFCADIKATNGYRGATAHNTMRFDIASVPAPGAALLGLIGLGLTARIRRRLSA